MDHRYPPDVHRYVCSDENVVKEDRELGLRLSYRVAFSISTALTAVKKYVQARVSQIVQIIEPASIYWGTHVGCPDVDTSLQCLTDY